MQGLDAYALFLLITAYCDLEEKKKGLSVLMKTQTGKDFTFDDRMVSIVSVIRVEVLDYTAKRRPLPAALQGRE